MSHHLKIGSDFYFGFVTGSKGKRFGEVGMRLPRNGACDHEANGNF